MQKEVVDRELFFEQSTREAEKSRVTSTLYGQTVNYRIVLPLTHSVAGTV